MHQQKLNKKPLEANNEYINKLHMEMFADCYNNCSFYMVNSLPTANKAADRQKEAVI